MMSCKARFTLITLFVASAKKVMFSLRLFICLLAKTTQPIFYRIRWKGGTWAMKKPLDFGGNPDHLTFQG